MSKTTSDPTKYYRAGFVIRLDKKPVYEQRIEALGFKTAGELIAFFVSAPGVVEALKPLAEAYEKTESQKRARNPKKTELLNTLKSMTAAELQALMESIKSSAEAEQG